MRSYNSVTDSNRFYGNTDPCRLIEEFGSPLYVNNESILRKNCREMKNLIDYPKFKVNYSAKANSNLALLKIVREEGLLVDAMSPGEIYVQRMAGFQPEEIFYIGNNVSAEEIRYAGDQGILCSLDSLSQLETFGKLYPGGKASLRFNPGIGAGHHQKVVTAGSETKFGIDLALLPELREIIRKYGIKIVGINQHIGSLFLEDDSYIEAAKALLSIVQNFDDLEFVDFGGGFGIPYHKYADAKRLDIKKLGSRLSAILKDFSKAHGKELVFKIEPGRYVSAECSVLLGTVHAVKMNYGNKYIGTDLGFNVLMRPVVYDSYHEIEAYRKGKLFSDQLEEETIVGNICETGDILALKRELPQLMEGDIIGVLDAGAYGFAMSSNYNNRLRPAEVMILESGQAVLTRRRDTFEDLVRNFV